MLLVQEPPVKALRAAHWSSTHTKHLRHSITGKLHVEILPGALKKASTVVHVHGKKKNLKGD